jgi:hypothetical protein
LPVVRDPNDGTQVWLTWLAAASDPALPVIGYTATAMPGGHSCSTTGALSCRITGLTPGESYEFTVVAINGAGPGDPGTAPTDVTAPVVMGATDRPADAFIGGVGWWTSPVSVSWSATDAGSGLKDPVPGVSTVSAQGVSSVPSGPVCDNAGNCASGSVDVRVDSVGPVITVAGVTSGSVFTAGAVPAVSCTATDATTGLAGGCAVVVAGGNATGVGAFTATATATDNAGNVSSVVVPFVVHYRWDGFSQPIDSTGHEEDDEHEGDDDSVFKAGSTIPVKFMLTDASGHEVVPVSAPRWLTPAQGSASSLPVDEAVYLDPADSGAFYKAGDHGWKYNWKTAKSQGGFHWRIGVRLDDGSTHYVYIALR